MQSETKALIKHMLYISNKALTAKEIASTINMHKHLSEKVSTKQVMGYLKGRNTKFLNQICRQKKYVKDKKGQYNKVTYYSIK